MTTPVTPPISQAQEEQRLSNVLRYVERCIAQPGPDQDILQLRNEREYLLYELEAVRAGV